MKTIRDFIQARQKKKIIKSIRESMAFFGHPLDDFSDKEIEEGTILFAKAWSKTGVTVKQATEAALLLGRAARTASH